MLQHNYSGLFGSEQLNKLAESYNDLPFDLKSIMEIHRKNIQAFSEVQQKTMQGLQALAQRQSQMVSEMLQDNSSLAKALIGEGSPEDKIAGNAKLFKRVYEKTVTNLQELSDLINKSNNDASEVINQRVTATMNEIQQSVQSAKSRKAQKA